MITGDSKAQIDRIWDAFWSGGISNPLEVMEQITYLLFLRRLDDLHTLEENKANRLKTPMERRIFPEGRDARARPYEDFRWSRLRHLPPGDLFTVVGEHVFPFLREGLARQLGNGDSTYAHHMKDARFTIPTAALLARVVDLLDKVPMEDRDTKGDVYEYMLGKIATAGQNGQFRTPRHIIQLMVELTAPQPTDVICDPATNPKGWPVVRVGDVSEVQGGLQVSSQRRSSPLKAPYLRVANVYRGYLDLTEIKNIQATEAEIRRTRLAKNDLLIVEGHGNPDEIGRGALWDGSITGCVHQNHIIRVRFSAATMDPHYACEYLNSPGGRRHLLRAGKTTSGLNTISVSNVRATPVANPPLAMQHEFAKRAEYIENFKATNRAALAEVDSLFVSLQHRAFLGEL